MLRWRKLLASTFLGSAVAMGTALAPTAPASAAIDLGGFTGPVTIHFQNFESLYSSAGVLLPATTVPAAGDQLIGILSVTTITSTIGSKTLWAAGIGSDGFLLGTFVGPTINSFNTTTGAFNVTAPWTVDLYSSANQYNNAQGTAGFSAGGCGGPLTGCYNSINDAASLLAGNALQLAVTATPGVDAVNPTTIVADGTFSLTSLSGSNFYDANVTGGAAAAQFNTNGVPTFIPGVTADFNVNSDFCQQGSSPSCNGNQVIGDWRFVSNDPVVGNVVNVPEPGSLGMLGTAILAFGFVGWRSRKRS